MGKFDEKCKHISSYNLLPITTILIHQDAVRYYSVTVFMKQLHALCPTPPPQYHHHILLYSICKYGTRSSVNKTAAPCK